MPGVPSSYPAMERRAPGGRYAASSTRTAPERWSTPARAILYAYKHPGIDWQDAARMEAREMRAALWRSQAVAERDRGETATALALTTLASSGKFDETGASYALFRQRRLPIWHYR